MVRGSGESRQLSPDGSDSAGSIRRREAAGATGFSARVDAVVIGAPLRVESDVTAAVLTSSENNRPHQWPSACAGTTATSSATTSSETTAER